MSSNHLILCHPLLPLPSICPQHVEDDGFPQEADGPSRRHARRSRPRLPYDDRPRKGDQSVSRLKGFKNIDGERGDVVGAAPPASVALLGRNELYRDIGRRKTVRPENIARRAIKYFFRFVGRRRNGNG